MENIEDSRTCWGNVLIAAGDLRVCRFGFIVAFIGMFVFWQEDQGIEVLRALGEENLKMGPYPILKFGAAVIGAIAWSLAGWYSCRVLLYFDFSRDPAGHSARKFAASTLRQALAKHIPRVIGIAPLLILARGFWIASGTYNAGAPAIGQLRRFSLACLIVAIGLYVLFFIRLRQEGRRDLVRDRKRLADLDPGSRRALAAMTVLSLILLVLFAINPLIFAGGIGTGAVLLLAAACWVFWGGAAIYLGEAYRFPVIRLAVVCIVLFSLFNDNHLVRENKNAAAPPKKSVADAFDLWYENVERKAPGKVHPLFIVASEGGGIRAAYWTATVLGTLEDESRLGGLRFSDHLFAISGVSGGSVGASVFDASLASHPDEAITPMMQDMLGRDFLAPVMAALLFPDLLQRFLPWPIPALDRGQWLEKGWERAAQLDLKTDLFAQDFDRLWAPGLPRTGWLPALFLNGTVVETGQPIIASNLAIRNGFLGALDLSEKVLRNADDPQSRCALPLSVATHGSARFTYVSPAGRFPDGTHIVDGGYFENSGCTTAIEAMNDVRQAMKDPKYQGAAEKNVVIKVIMISNDPTGSPEGGAPQQLKGNSAKLETRKHQPSSFLEDALAPIEALANTRDAHNSHAQALYLAAVKYIPDDFFYFGLAQSKIPLPLGWMLSGSAVAEMNDQMKTSQALVDGKDNPAQKSRLLSLLK